jgi:DNA helicase-2/ATP-dependent DNA helicase PcrA
MALAPQNPQQQLNPDQQSAATDGAAEVLTLACAGSGKSRTLAYRIAWLIARGGADPAGIVAFTFTEKAADSIKMRVADALQRNQLDVNLLGRMYIGTIHSYCQYLLGQIDARYRQYDVLDENRMKLFLIDNYGLLGLQRIRARLSNQYFETIRKVADAWGVMNEEMLTPAQIAPHDQDLAAILTALGTRMGEAQFIDFSSMQRLAVEALQQRLPQAVQAVSGLQHLLVDEYQDINPIQEELIRLLHTFSQSLFVVGDDDQSIYGWRGADVTRIQTFIQRYPQASSHTLAINYRSTQLIVSSADHFAHQELGAQRIAKMPRAAGNAAPSELRNLWFNVRSDEAQWVVDKIVELLGTEYTEPNGQRRGLTPADFAILMRSTRQNEPNDSPPRHAAYTDRLIAAGIDYSLEAGGGLFDRPHVALLRDAFELLRNGMPLRTDVQGFFAARVQPLFPTAGFNEIVNTLTQWGRLIHAPIGGGAPRRRIYPQQLLFDLLAAFDLKNANLANGVLQDIGVFSEIVQDVEAVFPSVDSGSRFQSILNFLSQVAADGYNTSSNEIMLRPDAVTVSTVHKMKGLEFPVVFVADVENGRFPGRIRQYDGLIPAAAIQQSMVRGAYRSTREEEARLFYTALTRAERFLYVTGSAQVPGGRRALPRSTFAAHLRASSILNDANLPTVGLTPCQQQRRIEANSLPTSFSDVRYYMRCPRDYQFRRIFGFSPAIPDLFGFGKTVHTSVGKLHEQFQTQAPTVQQARQIAEDTFHLKHIRASTDPLNRPGPYERAKARAVELVENYAIDFSGDFQQRRQVEARFEIPIQDAVVSGSIDLMIQEDTNGNIIDACVIDFKAIEGGEDPENNAALEWTALALQVQLYATAARDVLGESIRAGHVHLLKDNQRVEVPVDPPAIAAALANIDWAVAGIISGDFPMRPHRSKCAECDFRQLCPMSPQQFQVAQQPPPIRTPGNPGVTMVGAFELFDPNFSAASLPARR